MCEKTRDKVKKVALSLFAKNGYDVTSMEQIATGVGIKKSSLYAFITSKEALFWEIYEDCESQYNDYVEQLLKESESMLPPERLYYLFKHYLIYPKHLSLEEAMIVRTFWIRIMFFPSHIVKDRLLARALKSEKRLGEKYREIIQDGMRQGLIREAPLEDMVLSYYILRQGLYALMIVFMSDLQEDQKLDHIERSWRNFWLGIKGDETAVVFEGFRLI